MQLLENAAPELVAGQSRVQPLRFLFAGKIAPGTKMRPGTFEHQATALRIAGGSCQRIGQILDHGPVEGGCGVQAGR